MIVYDTPSAETCPPTCESVVGSAKKCFDELADFCQASKLPFWKFEKELAVRLARLVPLAMTVSQDRWVRSALRGRWEMPVPSAHKVRRAILEVRQVRPAPLEPLEPMAQQVRWAHPAR